MHPLIVTVVHVPDDARIYHRQITALLEAGHPVTYAAPWSDYGTRVPDREGLATVDLPRSAGHERLQALLAARRLLDRRAGDHDLVLVHDPELLGAVVGRRGRLPPVVWDVHEDLAASLTDRPWVPAWLRAPARGLAARAEAWADRHLHVLLAEEGYRDRFAGEHPVVPNYPWLGQAPTAATEDRAIYVGRISQARGARELIEAGRRLADRVEVELVGPVDEDVAGLVRAADRRGWVRHRGFMPNPAAMARVDGALAGLSLLHDHPNYRGSLPTKVLEYLSRGVPAITTPLPAAERVVTEHEAGAVVGFGDVDGVVEAVEALLGDPERRAALGERGRRAVADHFAWETAGRRFVELLEGWAGS